MNGIREILLFEHRHCQFSARDVNSLNGGLHEKGGNSMVSHDWNNKLLKNWKEQTSKTQKKYGGMQYINKKDNTQISIGKVSFSESPSNWVFYVHSKEEAKKGYPSHVFGLTRVEAIGLLGKYMRTH